MRLIIFLLLILMQTSCFIAPGMRMESAPINKKSICAAKEVQPIFIPIDVSLINEMNTCKYNKYNTYFIGPYDVLNIHVWGHREFSAPVGSAFSEQGVNASLRPTVTPAGFLVNAKGYIYFPIVGYVKVEGKTVERVRFELIKALRKYVLQPQVDVRVTGFRSKKIYVMGEVVKPGLQPLTDTPSSIVDAINLSGGMLPDSADPTHIFVIRGDYRRPLVYWLNASSPSSLLLGENFYLQPFDVVFVPAAGITLWNRAISQVLPTVQTAWMTYAMVHSR